jgi:hypothetical protein
MSARLSLVMGGSPSAAEGSDVSLPVSAGGTVHLHLHVGEKAGPAMESVHRSLGGWSCLIVGLGLMGAFGSGYQLGHRHAPDDVSNLRPPPALGSLVSPDPRMPSAAALGLPAIQRQLATPPQIIPPVRVPQQPGATAAAPSATPFTAPGPNRNAFGLEN